MSRALARTPHPWLAAFFAFGAAMCGLTIFLLALPGTALDSLWRLNPSAGVAFRDMGACAMILMLVVGVACASAAIGLAIGARWAVWLAIFILSINAVGDLLNGLFRHDYRTLIGLPIAGLMIWWLGRSRLLPARIQSSQS